MRTILTSILTVAGIVAITIILMAIEQGTPERYSNTLDIRQINAVKGTMVVIETRATVIRYKEVEEGKMEAIAIVIGDGFILAETHATQVSSLFEARTPFGWISIPQKILTEKWFVADTEIELIGRHRDISLFYAPFTEEYPIIPFGDSDLLEIGTDVVVVGWSQGRGINVKTGIVSRFVITDNYDLGEGAIKDITFMLTAPINSGDSGSPVLATKNNRYEIVGLVCSIIQDHGMGFAYDINFVKSALGKIMETSNVN